MICLESRLEGVGGRYADGGRTDCGAAAVAGERDEGSLPGQAIPAELDEIVQVIVTEVNPEQVILFGFRARGDARRNSDLDLVVVESRPFGSGRSVHDEEVKLLRAVARFGVDTDVLVCSRENFDFWKGMLNHVLARAARERIVVYARL